MDGESGWTRVEVSPIVCVPSGRIQTLKFEAPTPALDLSVVSDWLKEERRKEQGDQYEGLNNLNVALIVTRCLVPLSRGEAYATLSYVWGSVKSPPSDTAHGKMPLHLPDTIQDSIVVCNTLDIKYLWIDRYCIPQENDILRSLQISKMDQIYRNSVLTIVACAGSDPNYGLPGISTPRKSSPWVAIQGHGHLRLIARAEEIQSSIWATRAWTYQEVLLAERQLFFTENETFFGSPAGVQGETERTGKSSLERYLPKYSATGSPPYIRSPANAAYSLETLDIWDCIKEYSMRSLTYQTDALNAILGILAFYQQKSGLCHLWGIPFSPNVPKVIHSGLSGLSDFAMGLRWIASDTSFLREGFPSWSWTSCNSQITYCATNFYNACFRVITKESTMEVKVELRSGRLLEWQDYQSRYADLQSYSQARPDYDTTDQPSHFIQIEAFTSRMVETDVDSPEVCYCCLDSANVGDRSRAFSAAESLCDGTDDEEVEETFPVGSLLALRFLGLENRECNIFYREGVHTFHDDGCALLVRNVGEHWERVCLMGSRADWDTVIPMKRRKVRLG